MNTYHSKQGSVLSNTTDKNKTNVNKTKSTDFSTHFLHKGVRQEVKRTEIL